MPAIGFGSAQFANMTRSYLMTIFTQTHNHRQREKVRQQAGWFHC